jgi:hypothetical protein
VGIEIKLDMQAIKAIEDAAVKSAEVAMEQVRTDLVSSMTLPADTYVLQNGGQYVNDPKEYQGYKNDKSIIEYRNDKDIHVALVNDVPQARRLYYHPEYHYQRGKNLNAGGAWLEPYITGSKKDLAKNEFVAEFKKRTGV